MEEMDAANAEWDEASSGPTGSVLVREKRNRLIAGSLRQRRWLGGYAPDVAFWQHTLRGD